MKEREPIGSTDSEFVAAGCTGPATVDAVLTGRRVRVRLDLHELELEAQLAQPGYEDPRAGDRVLITVDDAGRGWVVGVISAPRSPSLLDEALRDAETVSDDAVRVRDRYGQLLFEYDPANHRAVVHVPTGDLEISVPGGAVALTARDGFSVRTEGDVSLHGGSVDVQASRAEGPVSRIALQPGELSLGASVLTAAADRAELLVSRAAIKAHQLDSSIERVRHVVEVLEVRAGRIVERARESYREVEGLSQTRAGRLRLVAKKAASFVGDNMLLKARDRVKIKGERIHLA